MINMITNEQPITAPIMIIEEDDNDGFVKVDNFGLEGKVVGSKLGS